MGFVYTLLFTVYFVIVIFAGCKVAYDYKLRQLVKANFWINVAIFALLALLTLVILIEFYAGQ